MGPVFQGISETAAEELEKEANIVEPRHRRSKRGQVGRFVVSPKVNRGTTRAGSEPRREPGTPARNATHQEKRRKSQSPTKQSVGEGKRARRCENGAQNKLRRGVKALRADNHKAGHEEERWEKRRKSGSENPKLELGRGKNRQDREPETNCERARAETRSAKQNKYSRRGQPAGDD